MGEIIDDLSLNITSNVSSAVNGIDVLSASLTKLRNATKGGIGLTTISNQLANFNTTLQSIDVAAVSKIDSVASSLSKLSGLSSIKISSSIGNQLSNIGSAATAINGADFSGISRLSEALTPLTMLGKSNLGSFINQLNKLPQAAKTLQSMNMDQFASQIQKLSNSLAPLANQLSKVSVAFQNLPSNIKKVANVTNSVADSNNKASTSYIDLWAKCRMAMNVIATASRTLASWITQSNKYIEDLNLFTASMGEYASEAKKYAQEVSDVMGIDPGEFMRNQGIFQTITEGFGVASDRAYTMSTNLTQLGYDLSSFFNISFEDSMQKLQSGISGELEPLRRLGYDLSQAKLQAVALSLGIDKSFNSMTQAEKAQLRYYTIMTQVTVAQGDMARTLNAPANQLRILQAQVVQCARALGNIFIPALNAVIPYAIAFMKIIRSMADQISSFFGFKLPTVDYSSLKKGASSVADSLCDAKGSLSGANKEAKKLKNNLLGIDELNVLSNDNNAGNSGSGSGTVGGAGDFDFALPTYDFLGDAVTSRADALIEPIKEAIREIAVVADGAMLVIGLILACSGANVPLGIALIATGAATLASTVMLNWGSMSNDVARTITIIMGIVAGAFLAIGAILAFSGTNIPLGIGLMAIGAASLATAIVVNWNKLNGDITNILSTLMSIVGGASLVLGVLLTFSGVNIPLGIGLIALGAVSIVSAVALNWSSVSDDLANKIADIGSMVGTALLVLGAILTFTGVNAGLGIALIAAGAISLISAITISWNTTTNSIRSTITLIETLVGGASLVIGAILTFTGVNLLLGIPLMALGAASLVAAVATNWDYITGKIKKVFKDLGAIIGGGLIVIGVILVCTGIGIPLGIALIAAGAASLISSIVLNWDFIKNKIKTVLEEIKSIAGSALKIALGLMLCASGVGLPIGLALVLDGSRDFATGKTVDWDSLKNKVKGVLDDIKGFFEEFKNDPVEAMKNAAIDIGNGFINGITGWFNDAKNIVENLADNISGWFKEKLGINSPSTVFYAFGGYTVEGYNNAINDNSVSSQTGITEWGNSITSWFSGIVNETAFGQFATDSINGFRNSISSAYGNCESSLTTWGGSVKDWFTNKTYGGVNSESFGNYASDTINGFRDKISNGYTNARNSITTWASNVKNWFSDNASYSSFSGFASDVIDGFKSRIQNHFTSVKQAMNTFGNSINSWFSDCASSSSFYNLASNVVEGFKNGIGALYKTCKDTITSWGDAVIDWLKDTLDIHSPSKVFYGLGAYTVQGFNNGILQEGNSTKGIMTDWISSFSDVTANATFAIDTSSLSNFNPNAIADDMYAQVKSNYSLSSDNLDIKEEVREAMLEALNDSDMAVDMRRQADKDEKTVLQIGNRVITDVISEQQKANGYNFKR